MARGDFAKKYRVWIDENGNEVKSRGRPSKQEMAARERAAGTKQPVKSTPTKTDRPSEVILTKEPDSEGFVRNAKEAIKALTGAASCSVNEQEVKFLKNFCIILEKQMMPKYLKKIRTGSFTE